MLRVYSWIFFTILCLLAIGVNAVSGGETLKLPWSTPRLASWMVGLGILGLLFVLLAVVGRLRFLLFVFSLYVLYLLVTGFFVNFGYSFGGPADARNALYLVIATFFAVVGAWPFAIRRARVR